jgi:hypothetical protein
VDHYTILDRHTPAPEAKANASAARAKRPEKGGISSQMAAANARLGKPQEWAARFPGEDSGRSLAKMAEADLDAALQLLADRAQYITGASGAAIALRRGHNHDMMCRASVGSNAPELGSLLSMEYGLTGESVRTQQVLRCDDTERDTRVNRDVCQRLGIASVIVMPVIRDQKLLGIFELLSGKANAFSDRDVSALTRLGEMVATAVKHSGVAETIPVADVGVAAKGQGQEVPAEEKKKEKKRTAGAESIKVEPVFVDSVKVDSIRAVEIDKEAKAVPRTPQTVSTDASSVPSSVPSASVQSQAADFSKKLLFWSSAVRAQAGERSAEVEDKSAPPVLRNLQKCKACGFPVSQARVYCVECEEKQWRGQRQAERGVAHVAKESVAETPKLLQATFVADAASAVVAFEIAKPAPERAMAAAAGGAATAVVAHAEVAPIIVLDTVAPVVAVESLRTALESSAPFLSSALQSESWFSSNKYVLAALAVVAVVVGVVAWLR